MKKGYGKFFLIGFQIAALVFSPPLLFAGSKMPPPVPLGSKSAEASGAESEKAKKELLVADFEAEGFTNVLGGQSGSWNFNLDDPRSTVNIAIVPGAGSDGKGKVLKITYSADAEGRAKNGFWTKLNGLDASLYDHLQFNVRGDAEAGCTDVFKVEIKKFKDKAKTEEVRGSAVVSGVTSEWQTIQIPLNLMTGILDFSDPNVWKNPASARKSLEELVLVFEGRRVSKEAGVLYLDNVKFIQLGKRLPSAVDFPPRKKKKTPVHMEGIEYARFLIKRLQGFPSQPVVKKRFSRYPKKFLRTIARDTWRFFDQVVDREHQLPLDMIRLGEKDPVASDTFIGDYTNVTDIGIYLICLVSAYDFGFLSKEEAVRRIHATLDTVEKLELHSSGFHYNYYDTTTLEKTSYFVSLVDSGWLDAGLYVAKHAFPEDLAERADAILNLHNFSFFYDPVDQQMYHGHYSHLGVYSDFNYGTFYTEPRAISYMAIGRGDVPEEHWFRMLRTFPENYGWQNQVPHQRLSKTVLGVTYDGGFYEWKGIRFVPSWGGSMFEALMPGLILDEKHLAPEGLGLNNRRHVEIAIRYATSVLGYPVWGMSPSSDPNGTYSEFGVSILGSKGYPPGVVTPHASVLALEYAPKEAVANLRRLIEHYNMYGEYGFYDAVDVKSGKIVKKYLALDQGMILIALNNFLNDDAIRKRFHQDPAAQKALPLLTEEKLLEDMVSERSIAVKKSPQK